jgi:hypothetical protein
MRMVIAVRWPFDKRADYALTAIVLGSGLAAYFGLPALLAIPHFRWWWPTNWMAIPAVLCLAGLVMLFVPLQRSALRRGQGAAAVTPPSAAGPVPTGPAPSGPAPGGALSVGTSGGPRTSGELAKFLLNQIPKMGELSFRELAYSEVPPAVMQQVVRNGSPMLELVSLADTFDTYAHLNPWQALLNQLEIMVGEEHPGVAALGARLRELGLADEKAAQ